jgi:hypothetical protein
MSTAALAELFWVIETVGPEGQDLAVAFTGTYDEARAECRAHHRGASITRADRYEGVCNA